MFISVNKIADWRDLQNKVCQLFEEMGYEAEVSKAVELAGRGKKEIDVYVTDPLASHNQIYLIECKHWESNVPQEVVHSFKFVMESAGANTGFIISKHGFQSGAYEAARFSNIQLLTFEELQHLYGNEWFRKQQVTLDVLLDKLRLIYGLHFEQFNPITIHNNMLFNTEELYSRLCYFHGWVGSLMMTIAGKEPQNYVGPEPVKIPENPEDPLWESNDWYEIGTVREYFKVVQAAASKCILEFEELESIAKQRFNALPEQDQDALLDNSLRSHKEETPIRVLRGKVGDEEYQRLLRIIA